MEVDAAWTLNDRHKAFCRDRSPKSARMTMKGATIDRDRRLVNGIISTDSVDLESEVIVPSGLRWGKGEYFGPEGSTQAVYLDHAWADRNATPSDRLPIGKCAKLALRGESLYASTYITKRSIGDELLILMDEEALRGWSIGVIGEDEGPPTKAELKRYTDRCRNVIRSGPILEYSATSMNCNPDAVIKCLRNGDIRRLTASIFCPDEVSPSRKSFPTTGPANCGKTIMLDENMDIAAILG